MLLGLCPLCKASASCLGWRVECPAHVHPQWVAGGRPCSEPPPWGLVSTKDGGAGTLAFGKGSPPAFASGVACAWPLPRPCSPPRLPRGPRADWGGQAEVGLLTFLLSGELLAAQGEEVQGARQRLRRGWGGGLRCPPEARPAAHRSDSHPQLISQCWSGTAAPPPARPRPGPHYAGPRSAGGPRRGCSRDGASGRAAALSCCGRCAGAGRSAAGTVGRCAAADSTAGSSTRGHS